MAFVAKIRLALLQRIVIVFCFNYLSLAFSPHPMRSILAAFFIMSSCSVMAQVAQACCTYCECLSCADVETCPDADVYPDRDPPGTGPHTCQTGGTEACGVDSPIKVCDSYAENNSNGGVCVPIDGGLGFLIAGGLGMGVLGIRRRKEELVLEAA